MNSATDVVEGIEQPTAPDRWGPSEAGRLLVVGQLTLASFVVYVFSIGSPDLSSVFLLATVGYAIHSVLPIEYRLKFFVLLSIAGAVLILGVRDAAWLVVCGSVLIGLCHLPLSLRSRVVLLLIAGGALAIARGGLVEVPWTGAMWPILGSMFMFRLVLYMMTAKSGRPEGTVWQAAGYFFMLPNLVFPLFPVIDYQTFRRTYYDRPAASIYSQGFLWISRGIVHLLLYRLVYQVVLNDPADVISLGDLVQFMLGTFLLYLRISGQFHLCVGLLHLFGFRLPETHKLYYLAHSFTELWRRINIYWTDFMMKAVFYPAYFRAKRLGPRFAFVLATAAVFLTTWILHSYQWFWLRGGFPITLQDALFWGILGSLVIWGGLKELAAPRRAAAHSALWSSRHGLHAALTFTVFCFLWSLWSSDSVAEWLWMLTAAANVDVKGVLLLTLTLGTVLVLGGGHSSTAESLASAWFSQRVSPAVRATSVLLVLALLSQPLFSAVAPDSVLVGLHAMKTAGLNARDDNMQDRGYYEQLEVTRAGFGGVIDARIAANPEWATLLNVNDARTQAQWQNLAATGLIKERDGLLTRELYPSKATVWNGRTITTNRWGMRDVDYALEKPHRTLRIALLGPSFVMGSGVSDGETFESLVEARLNREFRTDRFDNYEILNFALEGQTLPEQVALLEDRVFKFRPDVVVATYYYPTRAWTERYLAKIVSRGGFDHPLAGLLRTAGLDATEGDIAVPLPIARAVARWVGLRPRMPEGEAIVRIRRITDDVVEWAIDRFARLTAQQGSTPIILGLNSVVDHAPSKMPMPTAVRTHALSVIDLFDVYPDSQREALRVAPWDHHPNAEGHRLIAERLYPELTELLRNGTSENKPASLR